MKAVYQERHNYFTVLDTNKNNRPVDNLEGEFISNTVTFFYTYEHNTPHTYDDHSAHLFSY